MKPTSAQGVLLFGPPGTGKVRNEAADAVAPCVLRLVWTAVVAVEGFLSFLVFAIEHPVPVTALQPASRLTERPLAMGVPLVPSGGGRLAPTRIPSAADHARQGCGNGDVMHLLQRLLCHPGVQVPRRERANGALSRCGSAIGLETSAQVDAHC